MLASGGEKLRNHLPLQPQLTFICWGMTLARKNGICNYLILLYFVVTVNFGQSSSYLEFISFPFILYMICKGFSKDDMAYAVSSTIYYSIFSSSY